ncbi:hypothetical protein PUATCC27989T_00704 [Phytobacter ursingii]|nr:hypothetical protein PUATCC27989T_00704 [Phytobacter ursingii]
MNKELSGAAGDVLHALFFRGALVDGDLPSKAGAAELRELGYMKTQDTLTPFAGVNYYNFLTPAGQEFAISYLVDSNFGNKADKKATFSIRGEEVLINDGLTSVTLRNWKTDSDVRLMESALSAACEKIRAFKNTPLDEYYFAQHFNAALTERIHQAVADALTNALKPGGVLHVAWLGR